MIQKNLDNGYKRDFYSVVQSDYKKSRIYKQILRRPENEKMVQDIKKIKNFNNRAMHKMNKNYRYLKRECY